VSDRKGRDQPSCQEEWKMCRKKRRIVMPMWCIYMFAHILCSIVVLFTCSLVRSHPDSRKALGVKPDPLYSKMLGWAWQQDAFSGGEARMELTSSLERGHEGRICEVLQENGCSSMYSKY
jgi:hypothetical protein